MSDSQQAVAYARGLAGAAVGGAIGYFAFQLFWQQGMYAMVLPGALVGIGCALASRIESHVLGGICAVLALLLSLYLEWHFTSNLSLGDFLSGLGGRGSMTLLMIALATFCGYWFGRGRALYTRR